LLTFSLREKENFFPIIFFIHKINTKVIICDTDKDNDDLCVDFMDEEDNWKEVFLLSEREC
jgi:hypothetical protein